MTDPVDTDALRARADDDEALGYSEAAALQRAAADEVDRLRADVESLQATIVCAPHHPPCALTAPPENTRYGAVCTCWKADAL